MCSSSMGRELLPFDSLVERERMMKKRLAKETEEITILARVITNTVRAVAAHTNKISLFSASLDPDLLSMETSNSMTERITTMLKSESWTS